MMKAKEHCCEEANALSTNFYIPCNKPAKKIIHSDRDNRDYIMCDACAYHSINNRGMTFVDNYSGITITDEDIGIK